MTNHRPLESETFIKRIGKKKKEFKIVSWEDEYKRRERLKKIKMNIHGYKLRVQEIKQELKEIEEKLKDGRTGKLEKAFLTKKKNNLQRKKNAQFNNIKTLRKERELGKKKR